MGQYYGTSEVSHIRHRERGCVLQRPCLVRMIPEPSVQVAVVVPSAPLGGGRGCHDGGPNAGFASGPSTTWHQLCVPNKAGRTVLANRENRTVVASRETMLANREYGTVLANRNT